MFACELHFFPGKTLTNNEFVEHIWSFVGALGQNGQTVNDDALILSGSPIRYICICPERDSLSERFHDKWGKKNLREIKKASVSAPAFKVIGEVADLPPACSCRQRPFVYIFTHFLAVASPVACGKCDRPIPLYRVPDSKVYSRNDFLRWQTVYGDCDSLFMMSGVGEKFGYDQMSRLSCDLAREGRELAMKLEKKWKTPVYYYLHRYYGTSAESEAKRRCPGCGENWKMEAPHRRYCFQCSKCRLLSVAAVELKRSNS